MSLLKREVDGYKYWYGEFKKIKLYIIESILDDMSSLINEVLIEFGMQNYSVSLQIEKTEDNEMRSISCNISDHKNNNINQACISGGEYQRITLAFTIGIAKYVRAFSNVDFGILAMDEPTAHLSETGVETLFGYLANLATNDKTTILVVDHHNLDKSYFSRIIEVRKDVRGSEIQTIN